MNMSCCFTDNPLYPVVGHFIVHKPALDINEIPLFNILLHSSSIQVLVLYGTDDVSAEMFVQNSLRKVPM